MAINYTTLFTRLGNGFYVQELLNTARGTTIPPEVLNYIAEFDGASLELKRAIAPVEPANRSFQAGAAALMTGMQQSLQQVLIETVYADVQIERKDLTLALKELIRQMVADSESVDAPAVAASASAITGNGDGVIVVSTKRGDGLANENMLAEAIKIECTGDSTPERATFTARGELSQRDRLAYDWPLGSGIARGLAAISAESSLIANGDFEDEDDRADSPDDWIVSVGTVGTTIKITPVEVQRIVVTGTPSDGTYTVNLTNASSKVQSTSPLAYNATGATLQAAINALEGFEDVEVSTSGTSPDFTHDITFTGIAGNLAELTVTNNTTGGTFTPSTVTAGTDNAYIGKALELDSDGSQLTALNAPVTLKPLTAYAFNMWALADVVPAAGVITVDLVDGIGGTVINDQQAVANSFTIDCTALTTSMVAKNGVFRTPRVVPSVVYLRIRISTAVSAGTSIYLDHASLAAMDELYPGGPLVKIFSGKTPFRKGSGQVLADYWTLTVTNDRAGEFQEWFDRNFLMRDKGLLLPSNAAGAETQSDALIA